MDSKKSNQSPANEWLALQQKMLDSWVKAPGQAGTAGKPAGNTGNPVVDGMAQWWKTVSGSLPDGSEEFVNKLMEQGRIYYVLGEQFITLLDILNDVNKLSGNWQQSMNEQFEQMKELFTGVNNSTKSSLQGVLGAWQQLPMDTLQRTFSFTSIMPGDFLQDMKPEHLDKVTDRFLSVPGIGYTREHQEQLQEGLQLFNEYQKVSQKYNAAMNNVCIRAFDAMRDKIIDMARKGEEITSLRQIYDLWIDCNEESYAEYVYSDEYSELYGRLTNSLMAVKNHGRNTIDELLSALSMPTPRTMNTMTKRQQELRREQKNNNLVIEQLQQEIAGLKKQVTGNSGSLPGTTSKGKSARTKKRKKTTAKATPGTSEKRTSRQKKKKTANANAAGKTRSGRKPRKKKKSGAGKQEKIVIKI